MHILMEGNCSQQTVGAIVSIKCSLPCKHIFALRAQAELDTFEAELCAVRWTCDYYRSSHHGFHPPMMILQMLRPSSDILQENFHILLS